MEKQIGKYKIVREIGKGGMGIVYKALDPASQQYVAVKVLPSMNVDRTSIERFHREAQAMARVKHPNLIEVYDVGMTAGEHYLAMEYIDGETLKNLITNRARLGINECMEIAAQIADAIDNIHQEGMIHRDIKPGNIMITSTGRIKLMDLGLVQIPGVTRVTVEGSAVGTAEYMSPEQVSDEGVDTRSDIYSFGVTIYEMLTGHPPFQGETLHAILMKQKNDAPKPIRDLRPEVPEQLAKVVEKAMAKNIADRYQRVKEVGDDIRKIKQSLSHAASSPALPQKTPPLTKETPSPSVTIQIPSSRRKKSRKSVSLVPVVLFIIIGFLVGYIQREKISKNWKNVSQTQQRLSRAKTRGPDASAEILRQLEAAEQHHQLGRAAYFKKDFDLAIAEYEKAIQFRNDYGLFYRDLALAFEDKGDLPKAVETWKNLLRVDQKSPDAERARQRIREIKP